MTDEQHDYIAVKRAGETKPEPVALKPCPFCGGEVVRDYVSDEYHREISCAHCGIAMRMSDEDWNTRALPPEPEPQATHGLEGLVQGMDEIAHERATLDAPAPTPTAEELATPRTEAAIDLALRQEKAKTHGLTLSLEHVTKEWDSARRDAADWFEKRERIRVALSEKTAIIWQQSACIQRKDAKIDALVADLATIRQQHAEEVAGYRLVIQINGSQHETIVSDLRRELSDCNDLCENHHGGGRVSEVLARQLNTLRTSLAAEAHDREALSEQWTRDSEALHRERDQLRTDRAAALAAQAELMQQLADIHKLATSPALFSEERLAAIADRTRPHHTPV